MTTAHRPTWQAAKGGEEQGGSRIFAPIRQYSAKDAPSHTTLKSRQIGQGTTEELGERDLRAELLEKEHKHFKKTGLDAFEAEKSNDLKFLEAGEQDGGKSLIPKAIDADDEDDGSSDDDSDNEDDEAELLAELDRIKKERAEEAAKRRKEEDAEKETQLREEVARGNPLLNQAASFQVKRRWDDDVVFKNQARGEPKAQKRFINDTIRNDFHKRFLTRFMK